MRVVGLLGCWVVRLVLSEVEGLLEDDTVIERLPCHFLIRRGCCYSCGILLTPRGWKEAHSNPQSTFSCHEHFSAYWQKKAQLQDNAKIRIRDATHHASRVVTN